MPIASALEKVVTSRHQPRQSFPCQCARLIRVTHDTKKLTSLDLSIMKVSFRMFLLYCATLLMGGNNVKSTCDNTSSHVSLLCTPDITRLRHMHRSLITHSPQDPTESNTSPSAPKIPSLEYVILPRQKQISLRRPGQTVFNKSTSTQDPPSTVALHSN